MERGTTLLAVRADAPAALDTAYDIYATGLYDYCRWVLGNDRLAADALADALLAAVGRGLLPTDDGAPTRPEPRLTVAPHQAAVDGEPLRAWIFAIARAECNARRGPAPVTEGGGSRFTDRDFPLPQLSLDEQWQLAHLRQALDQLDGDQQEIAELAFRHGFSSPAVAAILGRPLRRIRPAVAEVYAHLSGWCADGVAVAFAVPPFTAPPPALRRLVLGAASVPGRPRHLADRHGPYDRAGFPVVKRRRAARVGVVAAGVVVLAVASVAAADLLAPAEQPARVAAVARHAAPKPASPSADAAPFPAAAPFPDGATDAAAPHARANAPDARTNTAADPSVYPQAAPPPPGVSAPALPVPGPRASADIAAGRPGTSGRPAAATPGRRAMSTSVDFAYNLATKAWDARVTATVRGFSPAAVRIAVWWHDSAGVQHREPPTTQTGPDTYAAQVSGLRGGPAACAQAVAVTSSGQLVMGPVAGPARDPYCSAVRGSERR